MAAVERLEVIVGPDGSLVVTAAELGRVGAHAGDRLAVTPVPKRRVRSMLGWGRDPRGFGDGDLAAVRAEMGQGLGDDLTG